ncbi:hypothetical protein HELRODRAFT_141779, partial [Helobdella robusta]|uniref:Uncharacterized protein n=1 Tax=Helobdella robusta TaxID=6412 RepID=T1EJ42_HELRO
QCVGCGNTITDQFVLKVAPDSVWHSGCLKCFQCQAVLDENCTCFIKDGLTYCKDDYVRLFGAKCSSCSEGFLRSDLVMKARSSIFHLDCFRCTACNKKLVAGDEFSINDNNDILCKDDHQHHLMKFSNGLFLTPSWNVTTATISLVGDNIFISFMIIHHHHHHHHHKTTRIRTVLNEKQLHTLRTCYSANSRPDALMKEQLVEMTGLSPRVIRVWFQNKRCKDKKRSIVLKQLQQQNQNKVTLQ